MFAENVGEIGIFGVTAIKCPSCEKATEPGFRYRDDAEIEFHELPFTLIDDDEDDAPIFLCQECEKIWAGCSSEQCKSETGWQLCTVNKHFFDMDRFSKN